MCGRVFDPEEVSQTKLNPLKGRAGDRLIERTAVQASLI
jgi:hypothetical protein